MFAQLFTTITKIISQTGYLGISFFMALESMIFPIPSEAIMPFAGFLAAQGKFSMLGVAVASTIGSLIGSYLSYAIGFYGGKPFLQKFGKFFLLDESHLDWTEKFFQKHGNKAVLISRFIPIVRHLISIPAGMARMPWLTFGIYTALGATAWNMFLAWLGFKLKEKWHLVDESTHFLDYIVAFVLLLIIIYVFFKLIKKRKTV